MIDLETALADQRDLKALCAEKPLDGIEAYWSNSNYGFAKVLKEYAGYPLDEPVWAVIPHGVYLRSDTVFPGEAGAPVPAVLSYPEYRDRAYRRFSGKRVIPSAAPFLYALKQFNASFSWPECREGTISFPTHSTAVIDMSTDWEVLAEELAALPDKYQPITVCLHWQDFERGRAKPFVQRKFRIVSAGHFNDQEFLYRLTHLLSIHKYASSNDVGSSLFYATAAGVPYFLAGLAPEPVVTPGFETQAASVMQQIGPHERVEEIRNLFLEPVDEVTDAQRQAAEYQLGASRFKTPDSLLMDLQFVKNMAGR